MRLKFIKREGGVVLRSCIQKAKGTSIWSAVTTGFGPGSGRHVCVKRISPAYANALEHASMVAVRGHPGFAQLLRSYREHDGTLCLVMPRYGSDLMNTLLQRKRALPVATVRGIARDAATSLSYMHRVLKVAHLDVKPDNLFLDEGGEGYVLGDFGGVHRLVEGDNRLRMEVGTPRYVPPELRCDVRFSEKSDAWSLGVSLFVAMMYEYPPTSDPAKLVRLMSQRCVHDADYDFAEAVGRLLEPRIEARLSVRDYVEHHLTPASTAQ